MTAMRMITVVTPPPRLAILLVLCASALSFSSSSARAAEEPAPAADTLSGYLATWQLDRAQWAAVAAPTAWDDAKQGLTLRLLARLGLAPANLAARWLEDAVDVSANLPTAPADTLVRITGRAVFVAPQTLSAEQALIAGRDHLDLVRIVTPANGIVDVITEAAPAAWPRWTVIDEPAAAVGLPLTTGPGPVPSAEGKVWPVEPHALLLLGTRVSWYPPTPLGSLGMDYARFDTVADGQRIVAGDAEAFYGMLAAVGRGTEEAIEQAAGGLTDVIPLIDPKRKWFASHRGEAVAIEGTARKATRIAIDEPARQRQLGTDHYWELYVFVATPLIQVNKNVQDDYPIVCCVRTLPEGMPTGERIGERVRVAGFAFKRYAYPLPQVKITSSQGDSEQKGERRETPLLIGKQAVWLPAPSPQRTVNTLGWAFLSFAALIGLALVLAAWSFQRESRRGERRAQERLPDRVELPPGE